MRRVQRARRSVKEFPERQFRVALFLKRVRWLAWGNLTVIAARLFARPTLGLFQVWRFARFFRQPPRRLFMAPKLRERSRPWAGGPHNALGAHRMCRAGIPRIFSSALAQRRVADVASC